MTITQQRVRLVTILLGVLTMLSGCCGELCRSKANHTVTDAWLTRQEKLEAQQKLSPKPGTLKYTIHPGTKPPIPPPSEFYGPPRQKTVTLLWDTYPAFSGVPCGVFSKSGPSDQYWTKLGVSASNRWDDAGTNSVRIYSVRVEP